LFNNTNPSHTMEEITLKLSGLNIEELNQGLTISIKRDSQTNTISSSSNNASSSSNNSGKKPEDSKKNSIYPDLPPYTPNKVRHIDNEKVKEYMSETNWTKMCQISTVIRKYKFNRALSEEKTQYASYSLAQVTKDLDFIHSISHRKGALSKGQRDWMKDIEKRIE